MRRSHFGVALTAAALLATAAAAEQPAGMRVYRDPTTGRLATPPPSAVPPANAEDGDDEPLVEEPGDTPAGGVSVDLKGRFRKATGVTTDPARGAGTQGTGQR